MFFLKRKDNSVTQKDPIEVCLSVVLWLLFLIWLKGRQIQTIWTLIGMSETVKASLMFHYKGSLPRLCSFTALGNYLGLNQPPICGYSLIPAHREIPWYCKMKSLLTVLKVIESYPYNHIPSCIYYEGQVGST